MASVLIALGGNVGDVRATFRKAIAHICGMAQAALVARSASSMPASRSRPASIRTRCCS
jgi:7,8-dihydro-6-hydroxymethylpterin-pyrophosphokinase